MATSALAAWGATFKWNTVAIAELNNIGGPTLRTETIDATSFASANAYREFIAGLHDGGEVSIAGNFIPGDTTGQIAMSTDFHAGTARTCVVTFPTAAATTWTFTGLITSLEIAVGDVAGKLNFTATIKVSGKPVLAVTASADLTDLTGIEENAGAALTFLPAFLATKYDYNVTVDTSTTWVKFTPTLAGAIITIYNGISSQDVLSGAQSGTIAVADGVITDITLSVKETGKVAKVYTVHVYVPI